MIYKVQQWRYCNSYSGEQRDLSFSHPYIRLKTSQPRETHKHPMEIRNRSSVLRAARTIKGIGYANDWEYMVTFTFDEAKLAKKKATDRKTGSTHSLSKFDIKHVMQALTQDLRSLRKKYDTRFSFLLIPEMHKREYVDEDTGQRVRAYHVHGLMSGLPHDFLYMHPWKKCQLKGYQTSAYFAARYGVNTFSRVREPDKAVSYILKYLDKDLQSTRQNDGLHLYYASRDLKRPEPDGDPEWISLEEWWLKSNVMTGPFGSGYARRLSPDVCSDIKSEMRFHRLCTFYGLDDAGTVAESHVADIIAALDAEPDTLYSDFVYDLFGNERKIL